MFSVTFKGNLIALTIDEHSSELAFQEAIELGVLLIRHAGKADVYHETHGEPIEIEVMEEVGVTADEAVEIGIELIAAATLVKEGLN
jgi:hypothetical protein